MLAYKDSVLLIANEGFISQLRCRELPPTLEDFYEQNLISLTQTFAPHGMTFMSEIETNLQVNDMGAFRNTATSLFSAVAFLTLIY